MGEAECGKSEKLMKEEKPSDLCTEENTQVCICATKDDPTDADATWQFRCGNCDLKWRPVKDEAQKEKRKAAQQEKKRRMERMKMRRKITGRQQSRRRRRRGRTKTR